MDIVERLRDYADGLSGYAADMMVEAADEIERLRRIISDLLDDGDETDRAAAYAALKEIE